MNMIWLFLIIIIPQISCENPHERQINDGNSGSGEMYETTKKDCIRKVGVSKPSHCSVLDDEMKLPNKMPKNCKEVLAQGDQRKSGIYIIHPDNDSLPFRVYCDMETQNGGWIEIQKRVDGSVDFFREWRDYKHGFGDLLTEFWLGLRYIRRIVASRQQYKLLVILKDRDNTMRQLTYSHFKIDVEANGYKLESVGKFAGANQSVDSLKQHVDMAFSTKDVDQDENDSMNCAQTHMGAWWYKDCYSSNLNGRYINVPVMGAKGIVWVGWKGLRYVLKGSRMLLKPES